MAESYELRPIPPEISDAVFGYMEEAQRDYPLSLTEITEDTGWLIHRVACETLQLTDDELVRRARELDEEGTLLPEDVLGQAERRYFGSLLEMCWTRHNEYSNRQNTTHGEAVALAMTEMRQDMATRILRLTFLSRQDPTTPNATYHSLELIQASQLASSATRAVWKQLAASPRADQAA